jgi:hypothetical protein
MKTILSTFLLAFFLMGQVNLTWAKHFCDDKLVSSELTLKAKAKDCCGEKTSKVPMDCCEDEISTADADDFFGKADFNLKISPEFVLAFAYSFGLVISPSLETPTPKPDSPDKPYRELYILYETFLI